MSEKPRIEDPIIDLSRPEMEDAEEVVMEKEGEEEMQDLGGSEDDDKDEGVDVEQEEAKKEMMSVLNTVLDEEAEKNLHDAIEFKDYTGCPKSNGRPWLTQTACWTVCPCALPTPPWWGTSTGSSWCREP